MLDQISPIQRILSYLASGSTALLTNPTRLHQIAKCINARDLEREYSEGVGSTTEDPRIIGQTKDDELFVLRAFPH
jgi:hypothetical protein